MTRPVGTVYLAIALAFTGAAAWSHVRVSGDSGLRLSLSQTDAFDGRPLLERTAADLDLAFVDRDPSLPRRYFSVRWEGYWVLDRDRLVSFAAGADDRVTITLDERVVVDRDPAAGVDVAERQVPVPAGAHRLTIDYEQRGGGYSLEVARALDDGGMAPFDPASLFPGAPTTDEMDARGQARLVTRVAVVFWILPAGWLVVRLGGRWRRFATGSRIGPARVESAGPSLAIGTVVFLGATLLLASASSGPDYGRYADWANAYLYNDLSLLRTSVGSPLGLPLTQWAHGPGLIFSTARITLGPMIDVNTGAMVVGWLASLLFWWSFYRILLRAAGGETAIAAFGVVAAFVGTHAGFYSHHHASESLSLALVGVLALALVERPDGGAGRSVIVGTAAGLLLITRSNLAIYAVPALLWQAWQITGSRRAGPLDRRRAGLQPRRTEGTGSEEDAGPKGPAYIGFLSAASLTTPLAIAAAQIAIVNRWMTGSVAQSPYTFGNESFRSLDWTNPELAAVLLHPWHGLLPYHPLYLLGFVALVVLVATAASWPARLLWLSALVPVAANLYTQAAWYVWWMGTDTFGSRGLTVIAIPLMAALVRVIAIAYQRNRSHGRALVALVTCCAAWSYLMLRQGTSQFLSWSELVEGQRRALEVVIASPQTFVLALPLGWLGWYWLRSRRAPTTDRLVEAATAGVGLLAFSYLFLPWLQRSWFATARLVLPAALLLLAIWAARELVSRLRDPAADSFVRVGLVGTFVATTATFAALATGTERRLAAGDTPGPFETTATIHTPEVVASYGEYQRVEGFEDKKRALADYLGIDR